MTRALPIVFLIAAGLCLSLVLLWLWQSLRYLLLGQRVQAHASLPHDALRASLLREKQELLNAIRDVRVEHDLGKLSGADFERLEQGYRARARDVLRELETQVSPYREQARALLGDKAAQETVPVPAAEASSSDAARAACPSCGTANEPDAIFCKKCGTRVRDEATA